MKYEITGQIMIDTVVYPDGTDNGINLGGPSAFGYAGVKLWTDDVRMNINVGHDFYSYFEKWLTDYNADRSRIRVMECPGNRHIITYRADGSYHEHSVNGWDNMHNMDPRMIDFAESAADGVKALYFDNNIQALPFWREMNKFRKETGIKTLWEIPTGDILPENMDILNEIIGYTDFLSINVNEGKFLWGTDSEEQVVENCCKIPVDMLFLRAGEKGSYVIADGKATFIPSVLVGDVVDPTGCGNCSTAVAMYAWMETGDPVMTGVMANISAAYNLLQSGLYPGYSDEDKAYAAKLRDELYAKYSK